MTFWFANDSNTFGDYKMSDVNVTEETLTGGWFVGTNMFTPFTMHRTDNPDWSNIKEWGINNRVK